MKFKEFIKIYLHWFIKSTLLIFSMVLAFSPLIASVLLATFVNEDILWFSLLTFVTFHVGLYMLLKITRWGRTWVFY